MKNALSIDVEDWYHPELVGSHVHGEKQSQVVESTTRILDLLAEHGTKATFFVLGDLAAGHPDLVRAIHAQGHEVASHGMSHVPLWNQNYASFDRELKAFDAVMRDILGADFKAQGYRAPTFSLDERTVYALRCLVDNGYRYDSSVFPAKNFLYGVDGAPCRIYRPSMDAVHIEDAKSPLIEFPMTVYEAGRMRVPISGGVYLRLLPYWVVSFLLGRVARDRPFVVYMHPWETNRGTPRIRSIGLSNYFFTYYGVNGALGKLRKLLKRFAFARIIDIINSDAGSAV